MKIAHGLPARGTGLLSGTEGPVPSFFFRDSNNAFNEDQIKLMEVCFYGTWIEHFLVWTLHFRRHQAFGTCSFLAEDFLQQAGT